MTIQPIHKGSKPTLPVSEPQNTECVVLVVLPPVSLPCCGCFSAATHQITLFLHEFLNCQSQLAYTLGRAEMLRGLRNFLSKDTPEHECTNCLEERGVQKGSGLCSILWGWEQSVFNQTLVFSWGHLWEDTIPKAAWSSCKGCLSVGWQSHPYFWCFAYCLCHYGQCSLISLMSHLLRILDGLAISALSSMPWLLLLSGENDDFPPPPPLHPHLPQCQHPPAGREGEPPHHPWPSVWPHVSAPGPHGQPNTVRNYFHDKRSRHSSNWSSISAPGPYCLPRLWMLITINTKRNLCLASCLCTWTTWPNKHSHALFSW